MYSVFNIFSKYMVLIIMFIKTFYGFSKVRPCQLFLCVIFSLGQVSFSLDKYILASYLSLGMYQIFFFLQIFVQTVILYFLVVYKVSHYISCRRQIRFKMHVFLKKFVRFRG